MRKLSKTSIGCGEREIENDELIVLERGRRKQASKHVAKKTRTLTDEEDKLDKNVDAVYFALAAHQIILLILECCIVRDHNGNIEADHQYQPIPARLSNSVMRQNEPLLLDCGGFVLWYVHALKSNGGCGGGGGSSMETDGLNQADEQTLV